MEDDTIEIPELPAIPRLPQPAKLRLKEKLTKDEEDLELSAHLSCNVKEDKTSKKDYKYETEDELIPHLRQQKELDKKQKIKDQNKYKVDGMYT